jgi:predicted DNA-binding transcriptional regulator YafY
LDKTERLFAVMDALRRHRRPVTAQQLAEEQAVSVRTLYRDIQTLIGLGAPIDGEAGIGYMLRPGFFLPPLMFSAEELEALVLGAQWVQGQPDDGLSAAAKNALGKIATASPDDLRDRISSTGLWAAQANWSRGSEPLLGIVREAMRTERALHLSYADEAGTETQRPVWPLTLAYYEQKQIIGAWCTLRQDFRNFRIDRIRSASVGSEPFGRRRVILLKEWEAVWSARTSQEDSAS